jgi:head-tail adaptor
MKSIASLRHRITLCRQNDVVLSATDMCLVRKDVGQMWACIEPKRASTFSTTGAVIKESRDDRSHVITVRYQPELNVSAMAWIYEARLKSSPRWFKVLSVNQTEHSGSQYFAFDCRITDRGDNLAPPVDDAKAQCGLSQPMGLPVGVKL